MKHEIMTSSKKKNTYNVLCNTHEMIACDIKKEKKKSEIELDLEFDLMR